MRTSTRLRSILLLAVAFGTPAFAATDPTVHQVYEAAESGHLTQAQQMMDQVLRDHPQSARAHYVAAEVYARQGRISIARHELSTAQTLEPGLPFAQPAAVAALKTELTQGRPAPRLVSYSHAPSASSWGALALLIGGLGVVFWLFVRRRAQPADVHPANVYPPSNVYPQYPSQYWSTPYTAATSAGGGMPAGAGNMSTGSGFGSGIAGSLASGLAVGAGVVAGEELAHHVMDRNGNHVPPPPDYAAPPPPDGNQDMGGDDFGVSGANSWDDGDGLGSDDWA